MSIEKAADDLLSCFLFLARETGVVLTSDFAKKFDGFTEVLRQVELKPPAPPEQKPMTLPPAGLPRLREDYHWLHSERSSTPSIAQWMLGAWYVVGEDEPISPEEMHRRGWEYLGPVTERPHSEYLDR